MQTTIGRATEVSRIYNIGVQVLKTHRNGNNTPLVHGQELTTDDHPNLFRGVEQDSTKDHPGFPFGWVVYQPEDDLSTFKHAHDPRWGCLNCNTAFDWALTCTLIRRYMVFRPRFWLGAWFLQRCRIGKLEHPRSRQRWWPLRLRAGCGTNARSDGDW